MIEHSYEDELLKIIINNEVFFFNSRLNLNIFLDSLNKHIVYTIKDHYDKYNNFDFTEIVYGLQDNEQALNKYMVLHDEPCNKKSFEFFLEKTEEQYKIYKIKNLTKKVTEGSIEFENYISQINDISLEKNKNTSLEPNDIMEMITSNAEKLVFHKSYFYADMVQPIKHTVNIIGARTGVGKTALALNLLLDLSIEYKCLYINLELNESEIYKRLVSILSKVPIYRLGSLTNEEENYVSDKVYELKKRNLKIIQNCNTISKIKNLVASESIKEHCIVFIDHIGYIRNKSFESTRERIQETMISLNHLSKDYDCTIFALSQLSRSPDSEPKLHQLKDSGEIEQTAHSVVLLDPLIDHNNKEGWKAPIYKMIIAKNRGPKGTCLVQFDPTTQIFYEAIDPNKLPISEKTSTKRKTN